MSNYNLLLSLPAVMRAGLVAHWLPVKCTGFLDAAFCNRILRGTFFLLLRAPGFKFLPPDQVVLKSDLFYQYAISRGMRLLSLQIQSEFRLNVIEEVLQVSGSFITSAFVSDLHMTLVYTLYLVTKYCTKLTALVLHECEINFLVGAIGNGEPFHLFEIPALLKTGQLLKSSTLSAKMCTCFSNLKSLHIRDCSVDSCELVTVCCMCPQLQTLFISTKKVSKATPVCPVSDALVIVSKACTHLQNLSLMHVSFRVGEFQQMLSNLRQLQSLQLTRNSSLSNGDLSVLGRIHGSSVLTLSLQQCCGFNAVGLCGLLRSCSVLTKLFLHTTSEQITPQVIECIQHTALRSLYIFSHTTDKVKYAIGRYGKRLTHIGILCSGYDTGELYDSIVRNCTQLKAFYVLALPADMYDSIRTAYPWIDVQRDTFPPELSYLAGRD